MSSDQRKIGSLKDRIARFDNPDAAPVIPRTAFGHGGPARKESGNSAGKGLIGNRIPSYNARNVPPELFVSGKKQVENRGLYGNRIAGALDHEHYAPSKRAQSIGKVNLTGTLDTVTTNRPLSIEQPSHRRLNRSLQTTTSAIKETAAVPNPGTQASSARSLKLGATAVGVLEGNNPNRSKEFKIDMTEESNNVHDVTRHEPAEASSDLRNMTVDGSEASQLSSANILGTGAANNFASRMPESEEGGNSPLVQAVQNTDPPTGFSSSHYLGISDSALLDSGGNPGSPVDDRSALTATSITVPPTQNVGTPSLEGPEIRIRFEPEGLEPRLSSTQKRSDYEASPSAGGIAQSVETHTEDSSAATAEIGGVMLFRSTEAGPTTKVLGIDQAGDLYADQQPVFNSSKRLAELDDPFVSAEQQLTKGNAGFHRQFVETINAIDLLSGASSGLQMQEARRLLSELKDRFKNVNGYLPKYDQSRYQQQLEAIEVKLRDQAGSCPRKGFAFKKAKASQRSQERSPQPTSVCSKDEDSNHQSETDPSQQTDGAGPISCSLRGLQNRYITSSLIHHPPPSAEELGSIIIENIDSCIIDLCLKPLLPALAGLETPMSRQIFNSVYIKNVKNSVIILGETIPGSLFLDVIENCLVVAATQQFRMHNSSYSVILLSVKSTAIIERCQNIKFGHLPDEMSNSGTPDTDLRIEDFDWMKSGPSPNWSWQKPVRWPFATLGHATDLRVTLAEILRLYTTKTTLSFKPVTTNPSRRLLDDEDDANEEPGWAKVQTTRTKYP